MDWNWEKFEAGPVEQNGKRVHVTVNSRGNFFLNRQAIEALGDPESVELMYDRRKSTVGIIRAPASSQCSYRLKRKERARPGGRMLYAANFCRHFSICPDETLRFTAAEVNADGVLILDLNEVRSVRKV